jgi:hypothetical protein
MRPSSKRLILLVSAVAFLSRGSAAATQTSPVSVEIAPAKLTLSLHQPVYFSVTVRNESQLPVTVDLGWNRRSRLLLKVAKQSGEVVTVPQLDEGGAAFSGRVTLDPGQEYSHRTLLNRWFDFAEPGHYKVHIEVAGGRVSETADETPLPPSQADIEVTVLPRDPTQLQESCAALLREALESSAGSSERSDAAVTALTYIVDPVAVPYLEQLLRSGKKLGPFAIQGLGRIANDQAVGLLIAALNDPDDDTRMSARSQLVRMAEATADPELRGRIRLALRGSRQGR